MKTFTSQEKIAINTTVPCIIIILLFINSPFPELEIILCITFNAQIKIIICKSEKNIKTYVAY
ncbi:MAG: hypothetical protein WCK88_04095 [bacterium]